MTSVTTTARVDEVASESDEAVGEVTQEATDKIEAEVGWILIRILVGELKSEQMVTRALIDILNETGAAGIGPLRKVLREALLRERTPSDPLQTRIERLLARRSNFTTWLVTEYSVAK